MSFFITLTTDVPENSAVENAFDKPEAIGCFSLDRNSKVLKESTKMKKYYLNRPLEEIIGLDLSEGFDKNFKIRKFPEDKIDNVLKWIKDKEFQPLISDPTSATKPVDFVCARGAIAKLLCAPYSKDSWTIHASRFQDTIYFSSVNTEAKYPKNADQIENEKRKSYYGLKFEQYMTAGEPGGKPDLKKKCWKQGMFCVVVKNKIGEHTLLFRAEMDAVKPKADESSKTSDYVELRTCEKDVHEYQAEMDVVESDPDETSDYVGLKTCHKDVHEYQAEMDAVESDAGETSDYVELKTCDKDVHDYYIYKSLGWWAQSTVIGIKYIKCGIMDNEGLVTDFKEYETQDLPNNQKPYKCEVHGCKNKFQEPTSLINHVESDHLTDEKLRKRYKFEQTEYRCIISQCEKTRRNFCFLRKHVKDDHLNEEEIESRKHEKWSPDVCIHFLNEVLNKLKSNLKDDPKEVWQLDFKSVEKKVWFSSKNDASDEVIRDWYVKAWKESRGAMKNIPDQIPSHRDRSPNELDSLLESSEEEVKRERNQYRGKSIEHSADFSRGRSRR